MWRSLFLHEFIDQRISNYQALRGTPTPPSLALRPSDEASPGVNAVSINAGDRFEHVLETPLQQVIGVSCRLRLMYPLNPTSQMFPVLRLGAGAELLFWPQSHPLPSLRGTLALVRAWVGSSFTNLGHVELPATEFVDLRFDWHTSGQARILVDGKMVAYHNSVSPGATFVVDRVVFGMPNTQLASPQPVYHIARVFVRTLQRPDALAHLSKLLPKVKPTPDVNRCRIRVIGNVLRVVDRLREFMGGAHQVLSRPWSENAGPDEGPFDAQAIEAHRLATAAGAALVRMLRRQDYTAADTFLDPFTAFLRILHQTQPQQFAALAAEIDALEVVPEGCRDVLEQAAGGAKDAFTPIVALLTVASDRVRSIAGGN